MAISYRRTAQGAWELSEMVEDVFGDYLLIRQYFDYTKAEATQLFKFAIKKASKK
jgi:hypothetical protein